MCWECAERRQGFCSGLVVVESVWDGRGGGRHWPILSTIGDKQQLVKGKGIKKGILILTGLPGDNSKCPILTT